MGMDAKGIKQTPRARSSSSRPSSSSSSDSGSVTPNYSREKTGKNSSRKTTVNSNFDHNNRKGYSFVNRDKVRLVGGKIVRGEEVMSQHSSGYDLTAVKKRPRMALSHSGAVLHFIA